MSQVPLVFELVKARLLQKIRRQWRRGDRLPPIHELARQLDAGEKNTHRAVQALQRDGVLTSRPRRGTFVLRDPAATGPASAEHTEGAAVAPPSGPPTLWVDYTRVREPMIRRMGIGFREQAVRAGVQFINGEPGAAEKKTTDFREEPAQGIVVFNVDERWKPQLRPDQCLVVVSTGSWQFSQLAARHDMVTVDQEQGAALAGAYLRAMQIESTCFLGATGTSVTAWDAVSTIRLRGFERGWGRRVPAAQHLAARYYSCEFGAESVAAYLEMRPRPRAIFAATDELAVGFVMGAAAHRMHPGRDYQIIGFDGQDIGRRLRFGTLTTIDVPAEEMGAQAADLLLQRLRQPHQAARCVTLSCGLFAGETVKDGR